MDNCIVDVDVARRIVATKARTAITTTIYFDVGTIDGAVSTSVKTVGDGARTIKPSVVDISDRACSKRVKICGAIVSCYIDIG